MTYQIHPLFRDDPRPHYREFARLVCDHYRSHPSPDPAIQHGLLSLVAPDRIWAILPGNNAASPRLQVDINGFFALPPTPAGNSTNAVVANHTAEVARLSKANEFLAKSMERMLASIPKEIRDEVSNPDFGLAGVTFAQLFALMDTRYGIVTAVEINAAMNIIKTKIGPTQAIEEYLSVHNTAHQTLLAAQQQLSEFQRFSHIRDGIQHVPLYHDLLKAYLLTTPLPVNQTFASVSAYLRLHAPNTTTTTTEFGYNAHGLDSASIAAQIIADPTFMNAVAMAAQTQPGRTSTSKRYPNPRNSRPTANPNANKPSDTRNKWCWFHEYNSTHTGAECARLRDTMFSDACRQAKAPGEITNQQAFA